MRLPGVHSVSMSIDSGRISEGVFFFLFLFQSGVWGTNAWIKGRGRVRDLDLLAGEERAGSSV